MKTVLTIAAGSCDRGAGFQTNLMRMTRNDAYMGHATGAGVTDVQSERRNKKQ